MNRRLLRILAGSLPLQKGLSSRTGLAGYLVVSSVALTFFLEIFSRYSVASKFEAPGFAGLGEFRVSG